MTNAEKYKGANKMKFIDIDEFKEYLEDEIKCAETDEKTCADHGDYANEIENHGYAKALDDLLYAIQSKYPPKWVKEV